MFVASKNDNFHQGHDDQLERCRDSEDGTERDENSGWREIGIQQTVLKAGNNKLLIVIVIH